ncbi:MAG: SCP2 sterol-binding domain-containing protein [Porcipelethomonas sp.]
MTYEEIVKKVEKEFGSADVSNYEDHLALQINATGEGAGIFYIEINEGKLYVAPFDYKNNNAVLTADGNDIVDIFSGKLTEADALESGKLVVEGDLAKALSIQPYIKVKTAKRKTVSKKAEPAAVKAEPEVKLSEAVKKTVKSKTVDSPVKETKTSAKTAAKTASKTASKAVKDTAVKTKTTAKKNKTGNSKG